MIEIDHDLAEMADAAIRLVNTATPSERRTEGGSLTVIGTGIRAITQLTLEAIAEIRQAESLLHVIGEPRQEEVLRALNPVAQSLTTYYSADTDRGVTYEAMIKHIMSGKRTVAAFYGHPGVFVYPTHESVRRTRAAGYPARMLPAISAEGCQAQLVEAGIVFQEDNSSLNLAIRGDHRHTTRSWSQVLMP